MPGGLHAIGFATHFQFAFVSMDVDGVGVISNYR